MSVNVDLLLSMIFLCGTTAGIGFYSQNLAALHIVPLVVIGLRLALVSTFLLPLAWQLKLRHEPLEP